MTKLTNILRGAVVTAMITFSAFGVSVNATELDGQVKQDLISALGKVFSNQVSAIASEINKDISATIDEKLVEMGFEIAQQGEQEAKKVINKSSQDK